VVGRQSGRAATSAGVSRGTDGAGGTSAGGCGIPDGSAYGSWPQCGRCRARARGKDRAQNQHQEVHSAVAARHRLRIANVFHAGDGNIHPILLYDERDPDEVRRVIAAGHEILRACVDLGGSITGEHGIGVEKIKELPLLFSPQDLLAMQALRAAFDPEQRCNPGKIFPTPGSCVEVTRPRRQVPS